MSEAEELAPRCGEVSEAEQEALDAVSGARLTLVIGESDTGKTSLVTRLASALSARGLSVAVVDADLGQSEIGPPTTIGLGRVSKPLGRLSEAELLAMRFVGTTSPARDSLGAVAGTRILVDRARSLGIERVLVDTSGLVRGELGRRLKQAKVDVLGPDVVIALQRDGECEPILHGYARSARPRIVRLGGVVPARRRTPDERRRHRERALAAHLSGAHALTLDLSRVILRAPALFVGPPVNPDDVRAAGRELDTDIAWAEWRAGDVVIVSRALDDARLKLIGRRLGAASVAYHDVDDFEGLLAGLDDAAQDTLGLGVVSAIDFRSRAMTLTTAVTAARVASVTVGRERYLAPAAHSRGD